METRFVHCSACDQEVELVLPGSDGEDGRNADLSGAICMDAGRHCGGSTCPLSAMPPRDMRRRIERIRGWAADGE